MFVLDIVSYFLNFFFFLVLQLMQCLQVDVFRSMFCSSLNYIYFSFYILGLARECECFLPCLCAHFPPEIVLRFLCVPYFHKAFGGIWFMSWETILYLHCSYLNNGAEGGERKKKREYLPQKRKNLSE